MATSAFRLYNEAKKYLLTGAIDLDTSVLKVALGRGPAAAAISLYTLSTWASAAAAANVVSGGGYAEKTLTGITVGSGASAKVIRFDASDLIWTASGAATVSVKYLMIGVSGGKALGWVHLTDTAFDLATSNTLTIQWSANGIFELSGGVT